MKSDCCINTYYGIDVVLNGGIIYEEKNEADYF